MTRTPFLALALIACANFLEPAGAERIPAPEAAATSWAYVLDCSGLGGDTDGWRGLDWYQVPADPGTGLMRCWETWTDGCYDAPRSIYLLAGRTDDPWLESHELLHYRLGGDPGHSSPAWKACGL